MFFSFYMHTTINNLRTVSNTVFVITGNFNEALQRENPTLMKPKLKASSVKLLCQRGEHG